MTAPNKSLGQHWLYDRPTLEYIADCAELTKKDTVLEIGPGLGTLTSALLRQAGNVHAVEFDEQLAKKLPGQFPGTNLTVCNEDILKFDFTQLPEKYKVVANVPYYITSKIVERLMTAENKPSVAVLLVQKEVAERLAATPGNMSILAVSAQLFAHVELGETVPAKLFTPPPKVDSAVVIMKTLDTPRITSKNERALFRLVKAGFSAKRKKLRSSISGGLGISKEQAELFLQKSGINSNARAEDLSIDEWLAFLESGVITA